MAFNKVALQQSLQTGLTTILSQPQTTNNAATVASQVATLFANAIDVYAKTGNAVGTDSNGDSHSLNLL